MKLFQDDERDEERDERESKTYRVIRGCFKGVLYGASALVWILVLYVVFTTRESKLMDRMFFTERTQAVASQTEGYRVEQLLLRDFLNEDGSIKLSKILYAAETGELELGVQYNKKLTDGKTEDPIRYVLTDENGTEYEMVGLQEDAIGRYGYARVCFTGITLSTDEGAKTHTLTLHLYRKADGKPLSTYINADHELVDNAVFTIWQPGMLHQSVPFED